MLSNVCTFVHIFQLNFKLNVCSNLKDIPCDIATRAPNRWKRSANWYIVYANSTMNLHIYLSVVHKQIFDEQKKKPNTKVYVTSQCIQWNTNRNVFHYIKFILIDVNEEHRTLGQTAQNAASVCANQTEKDREWTAHVTNIFIGNKLKW